MSNYCTFYIVRHGETENNVRRKIQGHMDSPLTQNGISQAQNAAKKLIDIQFDEIFSSDIGRAHSTAQIINIERNLAIKTTQLLRERNYGKYTGAEYKTLEDDIKEYMEKLNVLSTEDKWERKFPPIESNTEMVERFIRFLRETAVAFPEKTILVATHAGIIGNFLIHLGIWDHADQHKRLISNAGYIKLRSDGIDFFIEEAEGIDIKPF